MKSARLMFLLGSVVFAMGAVAGCGDDDDNTIYDAPVSTTDASTRDAAAADAGGGADSRVTDASTGG